MSDDKGRLRWLCRRGMLELDFLLERFLDNGYDALNAEERTQFDELLKEQDPVLFGWLLGHETPAPTFAALIEKIRAG